jgi:hypothetical protein
MNRISPVRRMKPIFLLSLIFAFIKESWSQQLPDSLIQNALGVSYEHLEASVLEVKDSTRYPSYAPHNLQWSYFNSGGWTSGFYRDVSGSLMN